MDTLPNSFPHTPHLARLLLPPVVAVVPPLLLTVVPLLPLEPLLLLLFWLSDSSADV